MPRKSSLKCYFGCIPITGKLHQFPPQEYPNTERYEQWKMVLSEIDRERGDKYICNNIYICDHHFEYFYKTVSGRLTKNSVPTLNVASNSTTAGMDLSSDNVEANYGQASKSTTAKMDLSSDNVEVNYGQGSSSKAVVPISEYLPETIPPRHASVKNGTTSLNVRNKYLKQNNQLKVKLLKLRESCKNLNQKVRKAAIISQNKAFLKAIEKLPQPAAIFTRMQLKKQSIKPRGRRFTNKENILCLESG